MGIFSRFFPEKVKDERSTNFLSSGFESIMGKSKAGVSVTNDNAMNIAGVYAAVRVISDAISSLPVSIIETKQDSKVRLIDHPLYPLLSREPNNLMTSFVYRQIIMPQVLLWGNSYSIIEFQGGNKRPKSIIPVHPSKVTVTLLDGILYYTFKNTGKMDFTLDQSNVLHFRGLGDNLMGKSVIDYAKDNLGLGKAAEEFGSTFFGNGANMHGVLQSDSSLSQKAIDNLRTSLQQNHGGISRSNKLLILEEGLKFNNTSIPPDAAQFLETRKFSITDVGRWFKIPQHMINDLEKATFSNIEQQDLNFVKHSILPYVINLEQELDRKLLREVEKPTMHIKLNLEGLLRGDIKTRSEAYKTFIQNGVMSPNEARSKEEMNPYEGGNSYWQPLNSAPVDKNGTNQKTETNGN